MPVATRPAPRAWSAAPRLRAAVCGLVVAASVFGACSSPTAPTTDDFRGAPRKSADVAPTSDGSPPPTTTQQGEITSSDPVSPEDTTGAPGRKDKGFWW